MTDNRMNETTEAQIEAAAKVLAPDGVFAEDFGEYSRKRDNYRREDQAEEQRYYMRKARAALVAAGVAPQPACLNCDEPVAESDLKANYVGRGYVHQVKCPQVPSEWGHDVIGGVGLRAERDAALAALERVRAEADAYAEQPDVMEPCGAVAQALRTALDGAPEPETPELFPGTNAALDRLTVRKAAPAEAFCIEHGNFHAVELGDPTCEFEDGLGEPVGGEQP